MSRYCFLVLLGVVCGCGVWGQTAPADGELSSANWTAHIREGVIVALSNRLAGEGFGPGAGPAPVLSADLRRLEGGGATRFPDRPGRLTQEENLVEFAATWPDPNGALRAQMSTRFEVEPRTGDLLITQNGEARERGLCGITWGLGEMPDDFELLVPGNSGQRFGKDAPQGRRAFDYPMGWEAPFVLIQGKQGGFIVRAEDPTYRFKNLSVERSRRFFRLWFESRNLAPFEDKGRIESSRWRLTAYRGPWQTGAGIYRTWAEQQHALTPLERKEPAWVRDIRFVVIMNLDQALLKGLAARCHPPQTLLYLPNWRKDEYDRNYPDYTAGPGFGPFVGEAHRLGFRVMPHVNYFGCDPKHPLYARFQQWQMRDPFTKEPQWWDWPYADPPIKFAYINPASRAWRELFVQRMAELRRQFPVDALHLDQTLCIFNDANGPIDGLNCIEGNLALHRDLRRALPEVALSGEGLNEVTCREEAFAQRHIWGMDHVRGTWDDRYIAMSHPVSSSLLSKSAHLYGYLGMPNPDTTSSATAWARAYERFGVLPTYPWPDAAQLDKPSFPVAQLLERVRFFQQFRPVPDFSLPWQDNDLFVYRLADDGRAVSRRDQGVLFGHQAPGQPLAVLSRRIEAASEVTLSGSVPGWPAYDATRIFGLDPRRAYGWSPAPRNPGALHLSRLPAGFVVARSGLHREFARFHIVPTGAGEDAATIRLWDFPGDATGGVRLSAGATRQYPGCEFADENGGSASPDGEGLAIDPPWKGPQRDWRKAVTFVDFSVRVPAGGTVAFESGVHLRRGAAGKSDGVRFRVLAMSGNRRLSAEVLNAAEEPKPLRLDLTPLNGLEIVLRLEADAGPADSPAFDWGRFARPMIRAESEARPIEGTLGVSGGSAVLRALDEAGPLPLNSNPSGETELKLSFPNTLILLFSETAPVSPPVDLLRAPCASHVLFGDGIEAPAFSYFGAAAGQAVCGGETRRALNLHPPQAGRSLADFPMKLPAMPLKLVTSIGLREGSKSNGVTFEVELNGRSLFRQSLKPGGGWKPIVVDLAPWQGQPVVLTLVTDAEGDFNFDWAAWAEPKLVAR